MSKRKKKAKELPVVPLPEPPRIRMLKTMKGSPDGILTREYFEGKEYELGKDVPFNLADIFVNDLKAAVLLGEYDFLPRERHFSPAQIRSRVKEKAVKKPRQRLREKVYSDSFFVRRHGIGR
jgi:hypothetical protein